MLPSLALSGVCWDGNVLSEVPNQAMISSPVLRRPLRSPTGLLVSGLFLALVLPGLASLSCLLAGAPREDQPAGLARILGEEPLEEEVYEPPPITGYEIVGNEHVSEQVILLTLESKVGMPFDEDLIDRDVKALKGLGYFSTVVPQILPYRNGVKIVYRVLENPYIADIRVEGNDLISTETILETLDIKTGAILNVGQLQEAIQKVNDLYAEKGYIYCGILSQDQFQIDPATDILSIRIAEAELGDINVSGNTKTRTHVITREMEIKRGELIKSEDLKRSLRNVFNLGYFEDVKPPVPQFSEDKKRVDLDLEVKEQKTGSASFGGGYSSVNGIVGFLDLAETNFRGRGQTARAKIQLGGERSYLLNFVEPYFRGKPVSVGVAAFKTAIDREEIQNRVVTSRFREKRAGGSLSGGWRVGRDKRLSTSFSHERVTVENRAAFFNGAPSPLPQDLQRLDTNNDGRISFPEQSLKVTWTHDNRDNRLNPTKGSRFSLTGGVTGDFLKGPNGFYQLTGDYRSYKKLDNLWGGTVLAGRFRAGTTLVTEGELRFIDRWAIGGGDSLRGYEDREFTGEDFTVLNLELRKTFTKVLGAAVFVDGGDAFNADGRGFDFKSSYGIGLRVNTPLGPFRLDYGKPFEGRSGRFHFGIGQQF